MNSKQRYMVPLLFIGTVLAGMLSPMQSAVNGQLGKELADGNACAVVSFGSGLVVMFIIILSRASTRQQFASIPSKIRSNNIPWWSWLELDYVELWLFFPKEHLHPYLVLQHSRQL